MLKKLLCAMFLIGFASGAAQAQQAILADDFSNGLSSKLYDVDNIGRDATIVNGVLEHDGAELGWKNGIVQHHEQWIKDGGILSTKESFDAPVRVKVLWAHQSGPERNDYFAVTLRGSEVKVTGEGAYKQAVLQSGISLVVHTNGQVQILEIKNGKPQQLAATKVEAFPEAGRVNWYVIEVVDTGNKVSAEISPAYPKAEKRNCTIEAKISSKVNKKANKVFLCNRQLEANELPGNKAWIRHLQIAPASTAVAKK